MTRGAIRRLYPVGPQRVRFDVAEGRRIGRIEALRVGRRLAFKQSGRTVRFDIPEVDDYEVVAVT
jgi:hypothetical protein